jgi:hypothetical protein
MSSRTPKGIWTGSWGGLLVLLITLCYPNWSSPAHWQSAEHPSRIYYLILTVISIPLWYFGYFYAKNIHLDQKKWKLAFIISLLVLIYTALFTIYLMYRYDVILSLAPSFMCVWLYLLPDAIVFYRKAKYGDENPEQEADLSEK